MLLDEVEQVRADLFGPEALGRGVEVPGATGNAINVLSDRPQAQECGGSCPRSYGGEAVS